MIAASSSNRIKTGLLALLLLAVLLLAFVALGPFISLYGLKGAIEAGDTDGMERYVDFPTLQGNIKVSMRRQAANALGFDDVDENNILAGFAMQISEQIIDMAVSNMVSPTGLSLMLSGADLNEVILLPPEKRSKNNDNAAQTQKPLARDYRSLLAHSEMGYEDSRTFVFSFNRVESPGRTQVVFSRQGLWWKLSNVMFDDSYEGER